MRRLRQPWLVLILLLVASPAWAAPSVLTSNSGTLDADGTNGAAANAPASIVAGKVLLLCGAADGLHTAFNGVTGFTSLFPSTDNGAVVCQCWYKFATGSEGATFSVAALSGSADDNTYVSAQIDGAHATTPPEAGTAVNAGTSQNPDPPALNPTGWDNEDALWAVVVCEGSRPGAYTAPTGYTGTIMSEAAGSNASIYLSFRTNAAASEDPGTSDLGGTPTGSVTNTIAIRPAAQGIVPIVIHQHRLRR